MPNKCIAKAATALGLGLIALNAAPAVASSVVRAALAIKNVRMAIPIPFNDVYSSDLLGIDREEKATRKKLLSQANEYVELRTGRMSAKLASQWLEACREQLAGETAGGPKAAAKTENPFCGYELARRERPGALAKPSLRTQRAVLAADLRSGEYELAALHTLAEINGALRHLDSERQLAAVAMRAADKESCVPPIIASAIAYKLEERFPAIEIVELTKRLYRKAVACGSDFASAQASFRLGLLQIWEERCAGVTELMLKVEGTPQASQFHARAKYWRFYCADRTGDQLGRQFAKQMLLKEHPMSFQALAATGGDDSVIDQVMRQAPPQAALRSIVRPEMNLILRAVEALIRVGATSLAAEIIDHGVKDIAALEPEVRLYVAVMMNRIGSTLPKFKILNDLFQDSPQTVSAATLKLHFPLAYFDLVRSKQSKIDPLLILSLIRQESAFNKEARSIAGARGLMQVMPATARMVSKVRTSRLYEPAINIDIGTKYFLSQLRQYDGDVEFTLAAYNAGTTRVDDWRKRYPTDNRLLFLDLIPFRETREYVSAILRNYFWYVKLYSPQNSEQADADAKVLKEPKERWIVSANSGIAAGSLAERAPASAPESPPADAAAGK